MHACSPPYGRATAHVATIFSGLRKFCTEAFCPNEPKHVSFQLDSALVHACAIFSQSNPTTRMIRVVAC
jgi:hypothetical protein